MTEINKRLTRSVYEDRLPPLKSIDLMVGALEPIAEGLYSRIMGAGDELRRGHQYTKKIKCGGAGGCNYICQCCWLDKNGENKQETLQLGT